LKTTIIDTGTQARNLSALMSWCTIQAAAFIRGESGLPLPLLPMLNPLAGGLEPGSGARCRPEKRYDGALPMWKVTDGV